MTLQQRLSLETTFMTLTPRVRIQRHVMMDLKASTRNEPRLKSGFANDEKFVPCFSFASANQQSEAILAKEASHNHTCDTRWSLLFELTYR